MSLIDGHFDRCTMLGVLTGMDRPPIITLYGIQCCVVGGHGAPMIGGLIVKFAREVLLQYGGR